MKILYDYQIFNLQRNGGISRYFYELMRHFADDAEINYDLGIVHTQNEYLNGTALLEKSAWAGLGGLVQRKFFWSRVKKANKQKSKRLLKRQGYNIFHPTFFYPYFLKYLGSKPFVLTVYDMIHEIYPDMFVDHAIQDTKKLLVDKADRIIAISENTKQDLIRLNHVPEEKISVVHLASSFGMEMIPDRIGGQIHENYILFVGTRSKYKNFTFCVNAMASLLREDPELRLICAGGGGFDAAETALLEQLGVVDRVSQVSITDSGLAYLYHHARAFIFPSLYEGFGIPVLEAFSCGCPAILCRASSLPEVGGNAAEYFNGNETESLREAVKKVVYNESYRQDLIRKGFERNRLFSWEKTAQQTKEIYRKLL